MRHLDGRMYIFSVVLEYAEGIINGSFTFKNVFFAFFLYLQELYFYVDE